MGVRLPEAYQEVEYISGTGIQYIDSGIECTSDLIVDFSFSSTSGENKSVCGGLGQSSGNAYFRHHCTPEHGGRPINFYWIQKSSVDQSSVQFLFTAEKRYYTYINPVTGRSTINGTEFTFTPLPSGLTTGKNYGILGRISYSGAIQAKPSTFYYFKFYRNDALIGDFVPCYRKADSEPGMYDLVTKQFFTNAGTGEFTVGPDVIDSISPWLVARRRLLMRKPSLDTSPRIAQYGVTNPSGNPATKPYIENANYCVTVIYAYTPPASRQSIELYGGTGNVIIYADGTYKDYWILSGESQPHRRNVINANTNGISCSLKISMLADSYAFRVETGEILFAGRNSIYYGHRNINELN